MPKPRIGVIPTSRLATARSVRDKLTAIVGDAGYAVTSICRHGYSVVVRIYEGEEMPDIPEYMDGIHIKVTRAKRIYPAKSNDRKS